MYKNNDIILIKETNYEHIDKIIIILNDNKKALVPEDMIIKQAENIIFEYERNNYNPKKGSLKNTKLIMFSAACFMFASGLFILGMHLF